MAKKEKVVDLKPTSITEEQLKAIQEVVSPINNMQMELEEYHWDGATVYWEQNAFAIESGDRRGVYDFSDIDISRNDLYEWLSLNVGQGQQQISAPSEAAGPKNKGGC